MKVWLIERTQPSRRTSTGWSWFVDYEAGCFFTKGDALNGATEGNGKFRVSRWVLTRATPKKRQAGRKGKG